MFDKKTSLTLIIIAILIISLISFLVIVYILPSIGVEEVLSDDDSVLEELYYVSQSETGYGICNGLGETIITSEYSSIARVSDSVFLKSEVGTYIYFLDDDTYIELGGKEQEVFLAYDFDKNIMPYFIFRYGDTTSNSVYRIYTEDGEKMDDKDFASLDAAYDYIDAINSFTPISTDELSEEITEKYEKITPISYASKDGLSQYIVQSDSKLYGIIDEEGRVILETKATSITMADDSISGIIIVMDSSTYILTDIEKLIEVDNDFEYVIEDNYIIQKKGNTVNKIYTKFGNILNSNVYDYTSDLISIETESGECYLLLQESTNKYEIYDMVLGIKLEYQYENIITNCFSSYNSYVKIHSLIYSDSNTYKTVDFSTMKVYDIVITQNIYSSLDSGNVYLFK